MIPLFKVNMSDDAIKESSKILGSGYIGQGPVVDEFESRLSSYLNLVDKHILTTNSATSAEHLALHMLKKSSKLMSINSHIGAASVNDWPGMEDGDEVLCTSLTCTATNWPVLANNFKIKWVDVNPDNLNMDLEDLRRKITRKTKVIYFVHWGGYPVDLDKVENICTEAYNTYGFRPIVIEDCAHSFGSKYKGNYIGSHGNICTFSFQAIKHLTSVDGGMLITPYQEHYKRGKLLRWYGIDRENNSKDFRCEANVEEWGFKYHMNDVNASIGMANLKGIDKIIDRHKENGKYYNEQLKDVPGVTLLENEEDRESAYWIYSMKVDNHNGFMNHMKECGIMVSRVHERNDKHTCVKDYVSMLPNLDKVIKQMICIPCGWWVTNEQREYIVDCIKRGW